MNICFFGSNSLIAQDLIDNLEKSNLHKLFLFSRKKISNKDVLPYSEFENNNYDLIINFIGGGAPKKINEIKNEFFEISNYYDDKIINYLKNNSKCKYIFLSSGAVYHTYDKPVFNDSLTPLNLNNIDINNEFYFLTKLYIELKHRFNKDLKILDIRIFNYVSANMNQDMDFFITDIFKLLKNREKVIFSSNKIVRDYIGPKEFFDFFNCLLDCDWGNDVCDLYSSKETSNFEIFEMIKNKYNAEVCLKNNNIEKSPTENKSTYFSKNHNANTYGYNISKSSLSIIEREIDKFLNLKKIND